MITGIVNAEFEPIISISICDSDGNVYTQDAIVDTGFNGWLSLMENYQLIVQVFEGGIIELRKVNTV